MTLVDKLHLPSKMHPTPYTVQWLKQGSEVTISKQALISNFIGPYCGEVLFDVLHMDACHLLLGTSWLYDNHVIHDGHANTYEFKYKGRSLKLTLLPLHKLLKFKLGKGSEKCLYMSEA